MATKKKMAKLTVEHLLFLDIYLRGALGHVPTDEECDFVWAYVSEPGWPVISSAKTRRKIVRRDVAAKGQEQRA